MNKERLEYYKNVILSLNAAAPTFGYWFMEWEVPKEMAALLSYLSMFTKRSKIKLNSEIIEVTRKIIEPFLEFARTTTGLMPVCIQPPCEKGYFNPSYINEIVEFRHMVAHTIYKELKINTSIGLFLEDIFFNAIVERPSDVIRNIEEAFDYLEECLGEP